MTNRFAKTAGSGEPRRVFSVRSVLRKALASVTRRIPPVRGLGRCILAADRLLTNSDELSSYEVLAHVNGMRLILDLRAWEQKFAFYYGTYETDLMSITRQLFRGGIFYDVGASIGLYSIPMAAVCQRSGGYVRAFEPVPQNLRRLEAQIVENTLSEWLHVEGIALSDQMGAATMELCDKGKPGNAKITGDGSVQVEVTTLDEVWKRCDCELIEFIKIDTEGWDAKIIEGGEAAIRHCRPNLLVEFNRERMNNNGIAIEPAWDFLVGEMSYKVFHLNHQNRLLLVVEPADLENLFFVRAEDVCRIQR
jgi:FkbM family methyltransferase